MVDPLTLGAGAYAAYQIADSQGLFGGNDDGESLDDAVNKARWLGTVQGSQAQARLNDPALGGDTNVGGYTQNPAYTKYMQDLAVAKNTAISGGMSEMEAAAYAANQVGATPPPQLALTADVWSEHRFAQGDQARDRAADLERRGQSIATDIGNGLMQAGNKQSVEAEGWMGRATGLQESAMRTKVPEVGYRPESAGRNAGQMRDQAGLYTQQYSDGTAPSAAQAQLQAGTDQAIQSQMSMARSSGSPLAMYAAQNNAAKLQQQNANSAAQLRAQEQQALRGDIARQQAMTGQEFRAMDAQRAQIQRSNIDAQNQYQFGMLDRAAQAANVGQGLYGTANQTYGAGMAGYGMELAYRDQAAADRTTAAAEWGTAMNIQQDQADWERQKRIMAANAATAGAAQGSTQAFERGMYETKRADRRSDAGKAAFGDFLTSAARSSA